jgi:DNA invertase Pin-like site-specific DNA recombinase
MANALVVHKKRLPQLQKMHRAAQYVRMSTDYQQYSIENQAVVIATYAELHQLTIVRTYRDEGESGLKIENRTGLTELIDDVQSGQADFGHLLVFDVSRWGRFQDVDESAHYEFICRKAGVKVTYCAEQFENDGSLLANIMKNIKRVMAAEFSRELSAKTLAGALRLANLGFKMGGRAPYGLQRRVVDDKCRPKGILKVGEQKFLLTDRVKLVPGTKDQIAVVQWIFDEYLRCKSQVTIARELNRRGVLTSRGKPWPENSLGKVLRNEAYMGTSIYNRHTGKLGAKKTRNPKELWIRSEGAIPPIIERGVFLRTKKTMEERYVRISKGEMLIRLRKVLMKKGKLSQSIINASSGLPSTSAYLRHFGSLRNLYRLIGYTGNQAYWDKLAEHKRWVNLQLDNGARLQEAFEKAGKRATLDLSTECLRIDNTVNISFRVARCRRHEGRSLRWTLNFRARWPKGWVVAVRLGENNETILDYVLLSSAWISFSCRTFWFSENTCGGHRIERFDTFEQLSGLLIRRVCKETRSARSGPAKTISVPRSKRQRRL